MRAGQSRVARAEAAAVKLAHVRIRIADWNEAQALVMPLRKAVFVIEQGVPPELELDEYDAMSQHAIAADEADTVVATGRLLPDGHIGRMAVAHTERRRGLGTAVLKALTNEAQRKGFTSVVLHAQLTATGFYTRNGFTAFGPVFMDAGIEHVAMEKKFG
jgi:predicted GNAT family N-acyltransferase